MKDEFVNIDIHINNLDRFVIRRSIFNFLSKNIEYFKGKLLDVGCGKMPYKNFILENSKVTDYIGLDIENAKEYDENIKADILWDGQKMPIEEDSFSTVMATEVLEHCPDPAIVLKEIYRVLKTDGIFFFTVPFLWNLHEVPNDHYRFTPFAMERLLKQAGFNDISVNATGGWHASMAQMLGLWVKRSPMKSNKRKILSVISKPIIKWLIKLDKPENVIFSEGQMITGLYGIAKKK